MMFSNSSVVTRRPGALTVLVNCWSLGVGAAPTLPAGAWRFCSLMAEMTSAGVRPELGQLVGPEPDPHPVVRAAEEVHLRDPGNPEDLVAQVDPAVVDQEVGVVRVRRRVERDQHQDAGALLLDGDALLRDFLRQARLRRRNAVLGEDVRDVLVRPDLEVDVEQHAAVAGVRRLHVDQPIDAVDLLLDGGGHRLLHRLGRRAGVVGGDADVGRGKERDTARPTIPGS